MIAIAAHINHIRGIAGVDSVGLGAGYDGINLWVNNFFISHRALKLLMSNGKILLWLTLHIHVTFFLIIRLFLIKILP